MGDKSCDRDVDNESKRVCVCVCEREREREERDRFKETDYFKESWSKKERIRAELKKKNILLFMLSSQHNEATDIIAKNITLKAIP